MPREALAAGQHEALIARNWDVEGSKRFKWTQIDQKSSFKLASNVVVVFFHVDSRDEGRSRLTTLQPELDSHADALAKP